MSASSRILLCSLIALSWLAAGCSSSKKIDLGGSCLLNSDCNEPLSCSFGRCHTTCVETRDCPLGQSCVKTPQGGVCQLPVEADCHSTSCVGGLVCAVDYRCRSVCQAATDCTGGQVCVTNVCADTTDLDANGKLPQKAPTGVDGGGADDGPDVASGIGYLDTPAAVCPTGDELCPCYGNNTCNEGLICASHLCVRPSVTGGSVGVSTGGMGGAMGMGGAIAGPTEAGPGRETGPLDVGSGSGSEDARSVCVETVCLPGCGMASTATDAAACTPLEGLVAWWQGENDAKDGVHNHDGTPLNGVTFATGRVGQAFSFNGISQAISVPDGIVPTVAREFSVTAWVYANSVVRRENAPYYGTVGCRHTVFYGGANAGEYFLSLGSATNTSSDAHFGFGIHLASSGWQDLNLDSLIVSSGSWYHVAGVRRAASMELWVNGELRAQRAIPDENLLIATWSPGLFPSRIGAYHHDRNPAGDVDLWDGLIDEVKIFNRALPPSELAMTACCR